MKGKSKNKIFFPNLILLILGLVLVAFSVFNIFNVGLIKEKKAVVLNSKSNDYYVIGKDPTALQKEKFDLLTAELEKPNRDYIKYAELVSESFVIDFFNWSNKDAAYDVGGLQYMYDPETFNKIAHYEYYQKIDVFNSAYGKGQLPEVTNINSKVEKTSDFTVEDKSFEAYHAKVTWDYTGSSKLDLKAFVNEVELILVNDNGKLMIVDVKMVEEDERNTQNNKGLDEDNEVEGYE